MAFIMTDEAVKSRLEAAGVIIPEILLPDAAKCDLGKWPVIACDQFTSLPAYWRGVDGYVGDAPSTLRLILPEIYLSDHFSERVESIHRAMDKYIRGGIFAIPYTGFILTERIFSGGPSAGRRRWGLILAVDLDKYSYEPDAKTLIRTTEATIRSRLPPRIEIRRDAGLELPHVMLLIDDSERILIEPLAAYAMAGNNFPVLYDCELMAGGGLVRGYGVNGDAIQKVASSLEILLEGAYAKSDEPVLFAVGDGNHSFAAAKAYWNDLRERIPEAERKTHPARYALVEITNLHSDANTFEPIHRALYNVGFSLVIDEINKYFPDNDVVITCDCARNDAVITCDCVSDDAVIDCDCANDDAVIACDCANDDAVIACDCANDDEVTTCDYMGDDAVIACDCIGDDCIGPIYTNKHSYIYKIIYGGGKMADLRINKPAADLPVAELQNFMDYLCRKHSKIKIDYIHGADELERLAREEGCVCFIMPPIDKKGFFASISQNGPMPGKSFSMGGAKEKRYYFEARRITP
jgi:hypothetical protein